MPWRDAPIPARCRRLRRRACGGAGGRVRWVLPPTLVLSRCITTLPSNLTTSPPPVTLQPVGGNRAAIGQFDIDMLVRCHDPPWPCRRTAWLHPALHCRKRFARRYRDAGPASGPWCSSGLRGRSSGHGRLILVEHFGAQGPLSATMIGVGDILGRGLGPDLVGPPISRPSKPAMMRRFHRDLGAGDQQVCPCRSAALAAASGTG